MGMGVLQKFILSIDNFKNRISFITTISLVLGMGLLTFVQFEYIDDLYVWVAKNDLIEISEQIRSIAKDDDNADGKLSAIETSNSVYLEIYSDDDVLIYTTQNNNSMFGVQMVDYGETAESSEDLMSRVMSVIDIEELSDGSSFQTREEYYGTASYLVYTSVMSEHETVEIYTSMDVIISSANTASWALFIVTIFLVCTFLFVTIIYLRMFIRPMWQISEATKKIANMDFSVNCPSYQINDLNELSQNINVLAISLNRALHDLKKQNNQLEKEIETERMVDKTRRSFVANASHELKTPIAIIQGYAEGIKFGIGHDNTIEYCDTILDESVKMNNLVVRLLELSRYDSDGYMLHKKVFNIHELILDFISPRIKFIEEQAINFKYTISTKFYANADPDLIRDVINNYVSNACSHICNEKELIISCKEVDNAYRVSVFNSGKQISEKDIDNIWFSFYRADKAHSRNEGRFGLGLSIVSSVQDLHGQKYGVVNHNNGVEFWFDIEKSDDIDLFVEENSSGEVNQ
ncbi:MAG: HAMP domain-containing sensor histidine kinase [Clostridia bacterium]